MYSESLARLITSLLKNRDMSGIECESLYRQIKNLAHESNPASLYSILVDRDWHAHTTYGNYEASKHNVQKSNISFAYSARNFVRSSFPVQVIYFSQTINSHKHTIKNDTQYAMAATGWLQWDR